MRAKSRKRIPLIALLEYTGVCVIITVGEYIYTWLLHCTNAIILVPAFFYRTERTCGEIENIVICYILLKSSGYDSQNKNSNPRRSELPQDHFQEGNVQNHFGRTTPYWTLVLRDVTEIRSEINSLTAKAGLDQHLYPENLLLIFWLRQQRAITL